MVAPAWVVLNLGWRSSGLRGAAGVRAGREEGVASCAQQGTLRLRGGSRTDRIPVPGKDKGLM